MVSPARRPEAMARLVPSRWTKSTIWAASPDHPPVTRQLGHGPPRTLGDHVGRVLLGLAAGDEAPDHGMGLDRLQQLIRLDAGPLQVVDHHPDAEGDALPVGVEETQARHALARRAQELDGGA